MPDIPPCLVSLLLSMFLVAAFGAFLTRIDGKRTFVVTAVMIFLVTAVSVFFLSRAAFLAGFVGIAYVYKARIGYKKLSFIWILILSTGLFSLIYFVRPESVNGRLLIWMVCLSMIKDKPWGYGFSGLSNNYMLYQADFFKRHPDSAFSWYADNVAMSYNEVLHIAINLGLIGLICGLLIVVDVLSVRNDSWGNKTLKGIFLSYVTFSMFSFPLSNLYTWVALFFLIVALKKRYASKIVNVISATAIIGGALFFLQEEYYEQTIEDFYLSGYDEDTVRRMCTSPFCFKVYPTLADMLLQVKDIESSRYYGKIVEAAVNNIPNTDAYCRKGDILTMGNNLNQALYYYQEASFMVPLKLLPKYKEFQLYDAAGDFEKAGQVGQQILDGEIKVHSSEAIIIKDDVKNRIIQY